MRETKFRLTRESKIVGYEKHTTSEDGFIDIWHSFDGLKWWSVSPTDTILHNNKEQYTGFKDKNGKEIYEEQWCNIQLSTGEYIHAQVKFIDGCFDLCFVRPIFINGQYRDRDYLKCWTCNYVVTIIENLELMK